MDEETVICVTPGNLALLCLFLGACCLQMAQYLYFLYRLVFGTLYPAYASYKAVRTKNVKEYVKWMMYWIVFALFTCVETFADIFLSFWVPFYYEMKILFILWLLSPATRGSSVLYRKFVHPQLQKREQDIDDYLTKAKEQGYSVMVQWGSRGLSIATNVVLQTALKGQATLVNHLRKSYSMSDLGGRPDRPLLPAGPTDHFEEDTETEESSVPVHPQRWLSEGTLTDESEDQPEGFPESSSSRGRSRSQQSSSSHADESGRATLRRTQSVATKPTKKAKTATTTQTSEQVPQSDVAAFVTLPRTKKSRAVKTKVVKAT